MKENKCNKNIYLLPNYIDKFNIKYWRSKYCQLMIIRLKRNPRRFVFRKTLKESEKLFCSFGVPPSKSRRTEQTLLTSREDKLGEFVEKDLPQQRKFLLHIFKDEGKLDITHFTTIISENTASFNLSVT